MTVNELLLSLIIHENGMIEMPLEVYEKLSTPEDFGYEGY